MSLIGREIYESDALLRVLALTETVDPPPPPPPAERVLRGRPDRWDELSEPSSR